MARPIAPTPTLTGLDAQTLLRELEEGTPMTPERRKVIDEARANFQKHRQAFLGEHSSRPERPD